MPRATGKKRKTIIEETLPDGLEEGEGEPTTFDVSMEAVEDAETLQGVLSQFGETNVVMKVLREASGGAEFCYQTDTIDEEFIQKNFGGGTYQVRIFIGGRYRKTLKLQIASRITPTGNPLAETTSSHTAFLEKMVLALISKENVAPVPTAVQPTMLELTTALSNLDNLRGKQESGIEMLMKGIELSQSLNSTQAGDWKTDLIRTAKDALPMFLNGRGGNPVPPGVPPQQAQLEVMLRSGIQFLKKKCMAGTDPNLIVEWVCANAEEEQYQSLIRTVCTTEFAAFASLDPEIGTEPYFSWFKPLYDGIRSAFSGTDSVDDDPERHVGDTPNPGSDGNVIPAGKPKPNGKDTRPLP